ncbi:SRPBCC domain-containing protein [uncultured Paraglaciecola sp.]|uniref:SRPBCC domain-containing protein n=1 Tax=uncultured Paraglaciecola sp. TaxID=1765024 RepID=UPI0026238D0B|nr:SRPBCC domain-containing protein [uncultured Paraglaciecola sp.]
MSIHQDITIKSSIESVYESLTNASKFSELSGMPAEIKPQSGDKFSIFGGMISGITIEAVLNLRLVQAWRVANWDEGIYSIVKFEVIEISQDETKICFDHSGFPPEHEEHLTQGWHDRYWQPMKKYLES